jgi:hypothetical protein
MRVDCCGTLIFTARVERSLCFQSAMIIPHATRRREVGRRRRSFGRFHQHGVSTCFPRCTTKIGVRPGPGGALAEAFPERKTTAGIALHFALGDKNPPVRTFSFY